MLKCFIRNFSILLVAFYTFYKLLNITPNSKRMQIFHVFLITFTSFLAAALFISNQSLNWVFISLCFILSVKHLTKTSLLTAYLGTLFSLSFSFITFSISTLIWTFTLLPFYNGEYKLSLLIIRIFIAIIQFLLIYSCFRIPRLHKGMTFLYHISSGNIGSAICLFLIMLIVIFASPKQKLIFLH